MPSGLLSCKQLLLHPPDQISSESEVQQGDSLGPCCFYCARFGVQPECRKSNDILQACYFDGGQPASCSAYFEEMGLHVYLKSRKGNSSFPSDQHNLDILEAKFIAGEGAESRKLLSGLVDVRLLIFKLYIHFCICVGSSTEWSILQESPHLV